MKQTKQFYLPVMGECRKSFYGKAIVKEYENGDVVLQSYTTDVCKITAAGEFVRLWQWESVTTMRHVNSFLRFYGLEGGGVEWWRKQKINAA